MKRRLLTSVCLTVLIIIGSLPTAAQVTENPAVIENPDTAKTYRKKFLVIDNDQIIEAKHLTRRVNQATVHPEPVIRLDAPWNVKSDFFNYITVVYDEQEELFKLWYCEMTYTGQYWDGERKWAYATSKDGIHWDKPILGLHEVNGTKENNYVYPDAGLFVFTVIIDPSDIPERRFKKMVLAANPYRSGVGTDRVRMFVPLSLGYSHDGLQWHFPPHVNPVIRGLSDGGWAFYYDVDRRKYILWTRRVPNLPRDISLYESFDLVNWEDHGRILVPGDELDPPDLQNFQSMVPVMCGDFTLGLLNTQHSLPFAESYGVFQKPPDDYPYKYLGTVELQLAYSRDGHKWHRTRDRSPVVPATEQYRIVFPGYNPVVKNGQTYIYFTGVKWGHTGWDQADMYKRDDGDVRDQSAAWLAIMPEDHWVSLDAGNTEGFFVIKPKAVPSRLLVNADAEGGYVTAEFVTPYGRPVEGLTRADCVPVTANGKDQVIRFTSGVDPGSVNQDHRGGLFVHFYLKNAKLYSYSFENPDPEGDTARYWANQRWVQWIKNKSNNWDRASNEPPAGLGPYRNPGPDL